MVDSFVGLVLASSLVDVAAVLGVLLRGGREHVGLGRCAAAALTGWSVWVGKLVVLGFVFELGPFAWVTFAYVHCVVSLPLIGGVLLVRRWWGRRRVERGGRGGGGGGGLTWPVLVGSVCALGAGLVGVWASVVEPRWVEFAEVDVPVDGARDGFGAVTVVVLADVQTGRIGEYEMGIVERVNALDADVVIVPGDLFQSYFGVRGYADAEPAWDEVRAGFVEFLAGLRAREGVYFVPGNTELWYDWRSVVREAGVVDLTNRVERVRVVREGVDRELVLAGTEWDYESGAAGRVRGEIEGMDGAGGEGAIVVYATHTPDGFMMLGEDSRVDVSLAGHTHGGQVRVPGYGALLTMARFAPREVGSGGLHEERGNWVYVSRGVGLERGHAVPVRLLCRPEVTVMRLGVEGDR